jgi:hypothetical protein
MIEAVIVRGSVQDKLAKNDASKEKMTKMQIVLTDV